MLVLTDLGLGGTRGGGSSVSVTSPGGGGTGGAEKGMGRQPDEVSLFGAAQTGRGQKRESKIEVKEMSVKTSNTIFNHS